MAVGDGDGNFERPVFRLGLVTLPDLGAHHARPVGVDVDAALESVPDAPPPAERYALLEQLLVGCDFELLVVALEDDQVALIDDAGVLGFMLFLIKQLWELRSAARPEKEQIKQGVVGIDNVQKSVEPPKLTDET